MRSFFGSTILLAAAAAACAGCGADPAEPDSALVTRPFTGRCETTFNPPPIPLPPTHQQTDVGTCELTPVGFSTIHGEQIINFAEGTQSGTRTITTANGDILLVKNLGTSHPAAPGLVGFTANMTFVGGTGRFANATGEARAEGVANLATRTTVIHIVEGSITYDASDRR